MKVRSDFVTNSSSSSFIIALKKDTPKKIIDDYINNLVPKVQEFGEKNFYEYENRVDDDKIKKDINYLFDSAKIGGIDLDAWKVTSTKVCNENDLFDCFLYDNGLENTDWLKTGSGD